MNALLEDELLRRAGEGDRQAFDALVKPHRARLLAHAYRMLGNSADAEDAVQDTLVRAWKHFDSFERRSSFGGWLSRIGVRASLTRAETARRRELPGFRDDAPSPTLDSGAPSFDVPWLGPLPDSALDGALDEREAPDAQLTRRQSVALAFLAAVQWLPALQRSVLLLTSVAGWSADEVAQALETTVPAVNSALQRARATVSKQAPGWDAAPPPASAHAELTRRYLEMWHAGDVERMAAQFRDDVRLAMPPFATWFLGRGDVVAFLRGLLTRGPWRAEVVPGHNGALCVRIDALSGSMPSTLHVLDLDATGQLAGTMVFVEFSGR